jgi:hypothetical protein
MHRVKQFFIKGMKKLENGTKYQKRCFSIQIEKFSEHQNIAEKDG